MLTRIESALLLRLQTLNEPTIEPLVEPVTRVDVPAAEGVTFPNITYAVAIMLSNLPLVEMCY